MIAFYNRDGNQDADARKIGDALRVARTAISDTVTVSTVLLLTNHRIGDGLPLIFETMIFGGDHDQELRRYSTEEEAMRGHLDVLDRLRAGLHPWGEE